MMFSQNVIVGGGPAPTRAYIEEVLPDIMEGRNEPGLVFDRTKDLDDVPQGYLAMSDREALKMLIPLRPVIGCLGRNSWYHSTLRALTWTLRSTCADKLG